MIMLLVLRRRRLVITTGVAAPRPGLATCTHTPAVSSAVGCSAAGLLPYYEQSNLLALSLKHNWAISWKFERQPLCCIHPAGSKKLEVSGGKIIVLLH